MISDHLIPILCGHYCIIIAKEYPGTVTVSGQFIQVFIESDVAQALELHGTVAHIVVIQVRRNVFHKVVDGVYIVIIKGDQDFQSFRILCKYN